MNDGFRSDGFPPYPVANPSEEWCKNYAEWHKANLLVRSTGYNEGWNDALGQCKHAQPSTAENPNESSYLKGHFDGVMDYGRVIRALRRTANR